MPNKDKQVIMNKESFTLTEKDVFKHITLRERIGGGLFVIPDPDNPKNAVGFNLPSLPKRIYFKYIRQHFKVFTNGYAKIKGTKKYRIINTN